MATDVGRSFGESHTDVRPPFPYIDWQSDQLWSAVRSADSELALRDNALEELVARRDPKLPRFLMDELGKDDLTATWQERLIFASEDVDFAEEVDRSRLRDRLYILAERISERANTTTGQEPLWAAVRRFTSLVAPNQSCDQAARLLRFLRPGEQILLQQAALQGIQNLFAASPPHDLDSRKGLDRLVIGLMVLISGRPHAPYSLRRIGRRVAALATHFLDPDVVSAPANAAFAINAIHALAVLGDSRLHEAIRQVRGIGKGWLTTQLRRRLEQVRDRWQTAEDLDRLGRMGLARLESAVRELEVTPRPIRAARPAEDDRLA